MGSDISKSLTPPPLTFQDCLCHDGTVDLARYLYYAKRRQECNYTQKHAQILECFNHKRKRHSIDDGSSSKSQNSCRRVKRHKLLVRLKDNSLRELRPEDTHWYLVYVLNPPTSKRQLNLFRNRFRIPYSDFIDLYNEVYNHEIFSRWRCKDAVGDNPSNLKLLILGSLRYLGRSWTFDDIYEAPGISREVNRNFFTAFIEYGSTVMYKKHVIDVARSIDIANHEEIFRMAGMNGCIGSSDATHVIMLKCSSWATHGSKGFKLNLPARTYNLTVTHSKLILCSTTGHPSTWNDKTLVLFDPLLSAVNDGDMYDDFVFFSLFEHDLDGNIVEVKYLVHC